MNFKDLNLKESYDSVEDNIIDDFLIPVMSSSIKYYRITGFFASSALAIAARGLFPFVKKEGKMKVITGINFHKEDLKAIKNGLSNPEKLSETYIIEELKKIEDKEILDRVKLLAWMVATGLLEIKIAVKSYDLFEDDQIEYVSEGLFHQKVGIFIDEHDNMISFSGSINETKSGWYHNIEEFKVFKEWEDGEKKYLTSDLNKFMRYWDNKVPKIRTFTIPEAAKRKLLSLAPKDLKELAHLDTQPDTKKKLKPWDHQVEAIDTFLKEETGILEMATGTGKTFTALRIAHLLLEKEEIKGLVIATKLVDLLNQWYRELIDYFGSTSLLIYRHYDEYKQSHNFLDALSIGRNVIHLTSYENLSHLIDMDNNNLLSQCLLICDEIHNLGSAGNVSSLHGKLDRFRWKLGLSATPEREYDKDGNEFVENEYGKVIFVFDLQNAISRGILCEFEYHPLEYNLTEDDKENIKNAIRGYYASLKTENRMSIEQLYQKLARVRKLSKAKLPQFKQFIRKKPEILNNCLIFVETREYGLEVQNIIHPISNEYHTYYSQDDEENLRLFSQGKLKCLITCRKIAEGIDIKLVNNIVIFSSARSKLETIQRLGRSLRINPLNPSKKANIIDFINKEDLDESNTGYEPADKYRFKWLSELSETSRV